MSVIIKGMEMPRCCAECDAEGHYEDSYGDEYGFFCPFGYKAYTRETRELKRLDDCPLVPVPDHGRLVDASEVEFEICESTMPKEYRDFCRRVINSEILVQTIIPASEEEPT